MEERIAKLESNMEERIAKLEIIMKGILNFLDERRNPAEAADLENFFSLPRGARKKMRSKKLKHQKNKKKKSNKGYKRSKKKKII